MKLSVITINYNNLSGLQRTVESVYSQEFKDFEYLIIDGGSTDGSERFITGLDRRPDYWCSEPDGGIYPAMNKGVSLAKGDYVLFINSGDTLTDPQSLERIVPSLGTHDFVYGNLIFHENDGREWVQTPPDRPTINFFMQHSLPHPATCIRRRLLVDEPYDTTYKIVADWVFFVKKIMFDGCSTLHVDSIISRFMMDGVSTANEAHTREHRRASELLFPPLIAAAGNLENTTERCGIANDLADLAHTSKLAERLRGPLHALISTALFFNKLFKSHG